MNISIGCDHAGFELKEYLKEHLPNINWLDKGCYSRDSVDYPDYAHAVAKSIVSEESALGVLICGSGNGISIAANKHAGIRAAIAWKPELASLARQHNDANILSLPARFITTEEGLAILRTFLEASFEGGRHQNRVEKINC